MTDPVLILLGLTTVFVIFGSMIAPLFSKTRGSATEPRYWLYDNATTVTSLDLNYDHSVSSIDDTMDYNPANGLTMVGLTDTSGNSYGSAGIIPHYQSGSRFDH
jgi:hypothetical protein